jgi:integrase/recombinase XerD
MRLSVVPAIAETSTFLCQLQQSILEPSAEKETGEITGGIRMLKIFRRHQKKCEHRSKGRQYRRCKCPIWVDGFLGNQEIRHSLKLIDWNDAEKQVRDWNIDGKQEEDEPRTIKEACDQFLEDARARELREATLYKYRLLFRQLQEFSEKNGLRFVGEMNLGIVRAFRASWVDHNLAALKKLERLRAFFRFAQDSGWLEDNPAAKLKNPKITDPPTLPLTADQVNKILSACSDYPDKFNGVRLRALVLLLRYSGLRIRDALTLERDRVRDGKLFLYTAKTGTAVWCPLPPPVVDALQAIPASRYFFWTGESKPKSCVGDWQRSLRRLFRLAGVPDAHAHRFRDTFAVELLLRGVPLERVGALLGHRSVKVTEKHYAPWVSARQEQLEGDVRRTWGTDLLIATETKGTPEVRGKTSLPN